jgi:hypothetical protein
MDRRSFMKDVSQVGIGLGVPGLMRDSRASTVASAAGESVNPRGESRNARVRWW